MWNKDCALSFREQWSATTEKDSLKCSCSWQRSISYEQEKLVDLMIFPGQWVRFDADSGNMVFYDSIPETCNPISPLVAHRLDKKGLPTN